MKINIVLILMILQTNAFSQIEKIEVPKGIVYKYCDTTTYEKAKRTITTELSAKPTYLFNKGMLFIGPVLWSRYEKIKELNDIKGGNLTILGYKKETSKGKLTQSAEDFKLV